MYHRRCRSSSSSSSSDSDSCGRKSPPRYFGGPNSYVPPPPQVYNGIGMAPQFPGQIGSGVMPQPAINQPTFIGNGVVPTPGIQINQPHVIGTGVGVSPQSPYFMPQTPQGVQPSGQQFGQQFGLQPGPAPYISNPSTNYLQANQLGQAGAPSTFARSPPTYGQYGTSYPRGY